MWTILLQRQLLIQNKQTFILRMTEDKHWVADLKFSLVDDVAGNEDVEKEAEHQTHAARWQTDDRCGYRGERSHLLLQNLFTNSSSPESGLVSYVLKIARRSWITSQLWSLLENDILCVLWNNSDWFCWLKGSLQEASLTPAHPSLLVSPSVTRTPEFVLTKQFWHDSPAVSPALRPLPKSGLVSGIHIKATKISNYSSSRKSEVKRWDGSDDTIKRWHWLNSDSYLLSASNQE